MKTLSMLLVATVVYVSQPWQTDFGKATATAREQHKPILLYFSGSDWCGPCIRLRKEIFNSSAFMSMADSTLILVNADFPRSSKHQLDKTLREQNDKLAAQYNDAGKFPLTVLINAESGKMVKSWEGFPKEPADKFIGEIKQQADAIAQH